MDNRGTLFIVVWLILYLAAIPVIFVVALINSADISALHYGGKYVIASLTTSLCAIGMFGILLLKDRLIDLTASYRDAILKDIEASKRK